MHKQLTDEDLAEAVRDGHKALWEELAMLVIGYGRRRINNHVPESDRDDVCQDTLIRFWRALPSFSRSRGSLKGFVAVMTQRQIADYYRARGQDGDIEPIDWVLDLAEAAPVHANPGPDLEAWIEEAVDSEAGKMLCMQVFEGYEYAEIGAVFGISKDAAKQRVYNARNTLRALIEANDG